MTLNTHRPGPHCRQSPQPVLRPSRRTPGQSSGLGDCPACRVLPLLPLRVLLRSLCPCPRARGGGEAPALRPHLARPVSTPARPLPAPAFMGRLPRAKLRSEEHPQVEWQRQDLNPGMPGQAQTVSAPSLSPSGIRGQAQAGTFRCCPPASPSARWAFQAQLLNHTALLLPAHGPPPHTHTPWPPRLQVLGPRAGVTCDSSHAHTFCVQFLSKLHPFSSQNRPGVGRFPGLNVIL